MFIPAPSPSISSVSLSESIGESPRTPPPAPVIWPQVGNEIGGEVASNKSVYSIFIYRDCKTVAVADLLNVGNCSNSGHL